jgi:hypothetical protein
MQFRIITVPIKDGYHSLSDYYVERCNIFGFSYLVTRQGKNNHSKTVGIAVVSKNSIHEARTKCENVGFDTLEEAQSVADFLNSTIVKV